MDVFRLSNGTEVLIRPLRRDDGPRLDAAYERLSEESKYRRFLAPKPHLSSSEVRYLVDIDGRNHLALVATPTDEPERIVGVARLVRLADDPETAELALVVGDRFQGQGLGSELSRRLVAIATQGGIKRLQATMLNDNVAAHRMIDHLGSAEYGDSSGPVDQVELSLAA